MRTLKKTLALVLVVAMVLSFGVIGANAAFTDVTAETDYADAINLMNGLGIINGMTETTFAPDGTLTREQAAKIIAYVKLGPTNAKLIGAATSSRFTDVAADRWSAGYIEYCANVGIILGNGDGTFNPEGKLTTAAFTKMLLCAVGYDANATGLIGDGWALNAATMAITLGMYDEDVTVSDLVNITRAQACQLAVLALNVETVSYTGGSKVEINGVSFVTGATLVHSGTNIATSVYGMKSATGVVTANQATSADAYTTVSVSGTTTIFNTKTGLDLLGHNVTVYYKTSGAKGVVYSVVDNTTEVAVTAKTTKTELKTALEALGVSAGATVSKVQDGVVVTPAAIAVPFATDTAVTGLGACTVLVAGKAVIGVVYADTYVVSKVEAYTAPTATANGSITLTGIDATGAVGTKAAITLNKLGSTTADNATLYEGVAVGDYVYVQKIGAVAATVEKAATVVSSVSSYSANGAVIGGTTYAASAVTDETGLTAVAATLVGTTEYQFVIDKAGNVVGYNASYVAPTTSTANQYGLVLDIAYAAGKAADITNGYKATYGNVTVYMLLTDGSKATFTYTSKTKVTEADVKTEFGTFAKNDVMKYAAADGVFTEIPTKYAETQTTAAITAKSALTGATGFYYTSATPFVYMDTTAVTNTAKLVTGYASAEGATAANAVVITDDTAKTVIAVFVTSAGYVGTPVTASSIAVITGPVVSGTTDAVKYDATLKANVYGYTLYVDGVATTMWSKVSTLTANAGYVTYTVTDGYLSAISNTITGYTVVSGTVNFLDSASIVLDTTQYVYNSAAKLVTYDTSDTALTAGGALAKDAVVTYALMNNTTGAIDYAFITVA